jgi:hypothetical protein
MMSLVKKKKKNLLFDATHIITVAIVEVDFFDDVISKKKKKNTLF